MPGSENVDLSAPESEEVSAPEKPVTTTSARKRRNTKIKAGFKKAKKTKANKHAGKPEKKPIFADIPEKVCEVVTKAYDAADSADEFLYELCKKMDSIASRIGLFTDQRSMAFYRMLLNRFGRMLRHFRVRRIEGQVRAGTGIADLTGWLLGIVYCMLPVSAGNDRLVIEPDFYEAVFEGQFEAKGHIRLCHAAAVAVMVLVNREFYRLLKKFKKVRRGE